MMVNDVNFPLFVTVELASKSQYMAKPKRTGEEMVPMTADKGATNLSNQQLPNIGSHSKAEHIVRIVS